MIRRPPRSTRVRSSAASDVYKRQIQDHEQARVVVIVGTKMQLNLHAITYMRDARCVRFSSHIRTFGAYPALVQHVSLAIAGARGDSISVAHAAEINGLAAVCDAVAPRTARAVPSTHTACICHISSAAALARGDARAAADLFVGVCVSERDKSCLLYTSPSPRDATLSRMPSSA